MKRREGGHDDEPGSKSRTPAKASSQSRGSMAKRHVQVHNDEPDTKKIILWEDSEDDAMPGEATDDDGVDDNSMSAVVSTVLGTGMCYAFGQR